MARQNRTELRKARLAVGVAVALAAGVLVFPGSSSAAVTAVKGDAYGYLLSVTIFNPPPTVIGPAPTVTLPPGGSSTPVTASLPSAKAQVGPAVFFTSGKLDVSTQGTTGPTGSVTSTANVANITGASGEVFTATNASSSCTSSATGDLSGTTTITGGVLQTDSGEDLNGDGDFTDQGEHAPVTVPVPTNPVANSAPITGHIHVNGVQDNFTYQFNEQITNPDGSITVYAAHERLLGPTAVGDLFIGKVTCGITGAPGTTVPPTSSTTRPPRTTTTRPGSTTSTTVVPPTTSTTVVPPTTSTTVRPPRTTTTVVPPTTSTTVRPPRTTTTRPGSTTSTTVRPPPDGQCSTPNGPISGSLFQFATSLPRSFPRYFATSLVEIARQLCQIGL